MRDAVVGRDAELAAIVELLDGVADGPAVLVLAGEAGIGKTTLWRAGVEAAQERHFEVLACRPAATEVRLSYAGLADLLSGIGPDVFDLLPGPQRLALDTALLRHFDNGTEADPRAVAAAALSLVDALARAGRVLLAVDDVQWLDEPTRRVLGFTVRRCRGPVAVLIARRVEDQDPRPADWRPRDPDRLRSVVVGPLSLAALHHLISQRTDRVLPRRDLVRIAETCGGNPFFALELARPNGRGAPPGSASLSESLRALVGERLGQLDGPVRDALLVASALAAPRLELVDQALETGDASDLLGAAEDHGVVHLAPDGTIRFTHPLLATGAYADASPTRRRALHRRLSVAVDDLEERARHLALAAIGPDPDAVAALDVAAARARRRGAPAAAAELLELAISLGARGPARRVQAANDHFHAGDPDRARELLEFAIGDLGPGPSRAEALATLGTIRFEASSPDEAAAHLEQALAEAADDTRLRSSIAIELSYVTYNRGEAVDARAFAATAVEAAERTEDQGLLAEALAVSTVVRFLLGEPVDDAMLGRALALEDHDRRSRSNTWPTHVAAVIHWWCRRPDALVLLQAVRQRCLDHGADSDLWLVWFHAVPAALLVGEVVTAERYVEEAVQQAHLVGTDHARAHAAGLQAALWAWVGEVDHARRAADEALALFARGQVVTFGALASGVVGMAELSLGDHRAAADRLIPATEALVAAGVATFALTLLPDTVEALVALGRLEEADAFTTTIEASGRRRDLAWAEPVGARCRGLLLAAQGRHDEALGAFARSLMAHDRFPELRYDRARTLLLLGGLQRRRKQRRAAHTSLDAAAQLFDEVGCRQWVRNARAERDRLGVRRGPDHALTPTEQRVAELAASGATVRQVAAALIVSPKTVEAHLTRIYRKLGIHSRVELAQHVARTVPSSEAGDTT